MFRSESRAALPVLRRCFCIEITFAGFALTSVTVHWMAKRRSPNEKRIIASSLGTSVAAWRGCGNRMTLFFIRDHDYTSERAPAVTLAVDSLAV